MSSTVSQNGPTGEYTKAPSGGGLRRGVLGNCQTKKVRIQANIVTCRDMFSSMRTITRVSTRNWEETRPESRPDICHQVPFELVDNECLLSLLDSPLNKAGMLKVSGAAEVYLGRFISTQPRMCSSK